MERFLLSEFFASIGAFRSAGPVRYFFRLA